MDPYLKRSKKKATNNQQITNSWYELSSFAVFLPFFKKVVYTNLDLGPRALTDFIMADGNVELVYS